MPLNGSDVASKPAGTTAVANTTIESATFNSVVDDIYSILNTTRTVAKGSTGASTEYGAVKSLKIGRYQTKSAGYTAVLADLATIFRITATATLALTAAATLGTGWWCIVKADGGDVTVDPDSSETINGSTTITISDGDWAILSCDGTAFYAMVQSTTSLSSPTITTPALTLKQSSGPTPTTEGDIQWDTDDNLLVIGDGSGQKIFAAMPASTAAGDILYLTAANTLARLAKGTASQALLMNSGATAPEWGDVDTTIGAEAVQATTSGNTKDFSIPAGARRITVVFTEVSLNNNDHVLIQLGDSGGIETTGYKSVSGAALSSTSGFILALQDSGDTISGVYTLVHRGSNVWAGSGSHAKGTSACYADAGVKTVSAEVTTVRITVTTGGTFDAGSIVVLHEL